MVKKAVDNRHIVTIIHKKLMETFSRNNLQDFILELSTYKKEIQDTYEGVTDIYVEMDYEEQCWDDHRSYFVGLFVRRYETKEEAEIRTGKREVTFEEQLRRDRIQFNYLKAKLGE